MIGLLFNEVLISTNTKSFSFSTSLLYALLGILIVIFLLAILFVFIITIVPLIAKITKSKKKDKSTDNQIAQPTAPVLVSQDNEQIVAVIMAAISATQNVPIDSFRVVTFKKL